MSAHTLVVNGRRLPARVGRTLLDTALSGAIVIPHDCATGQCNTCRVRVYDGDVDARGTLSSGTVLACRARIVGDAVIEFDEVPEPESVAGSVTSLEHLTPNVVQVVVSLERRLPYLPGQYMKVAFGGFPPRDYSPTLRVDGSGELDELVFHIRRLPDGRVSASLGEEIRRGSPVGIFGPIGSAYHRLGPERLVLVSSGVGWAPVWAVARASRLREPDRPMVVVAGAREAADLYMRPCLEWLRERGVATILTCSGTQPPDDAEPGRTTAHLPELKAGDTVMAAGGPAMVTAVERIAEAAGARCFADPFLPARKPSGAKAGILTRMTGWFTRRPAALTGI